MALQDLFFNQKDDRVSEYLYSLLHYSFGLPSRHAVSAGRAESVSNSKTSPLKVTWSGAYIDTFKITGRRLEPQFFMIEDSYSVYNRVDRDISVPQGRRYAYNFSKIQEGTLSATLEREGSIALQTSDEIRTIMNLIYRSGYQQWKNIPLVYVETGPIHVSTGIPDRIYIQLPSLREPTADYRNNIMNNIANHYNVGSYESINIIVQQDRESSSMNFQAVVKHIEPEFPFGYYHSIGLIDDEGMVSVDSFLGPVKMPADSEDGRAYLLNAGQKMQEEEQTNAKQESEKYVHDFFNPSPTADTQQLPIIPQP